ncbi:MULTISPECIES: globin domain-containing protein [unclassified Streptomyces]|uniref:globin domain-containing protein n=1 Tax=unclassified Streptomyces TaxID=2593676 RepID=UPI002E32EC0D|nr:MULTISPECIES: globin domain-containing protein [unclassified Streptomyces]WUC66131.1 globin domain-containing protein [Streptomyces sp. NBC_00539]
MRILKSSFAVVERRAEHATRFFYSHLFWHHPELRGLFPASAEEMERQRDRLFAALTHVIAHLDSESLLPYLRDLGRDHRKFMAGPEQYAAVGTSLLAALAEAAGEAWTPAVARAWAEAYRVIAGVMTAAAEQSEDPPWWDAEVVRRLRYGRDLAVLTLRPHAPLGYRPGQYVSVSSDRAPAAWRTYSLGNAPRPDGTVDLHVSRIEGGRLSTVLVGGTDPGEVLRLGAPGGGLTLRREGRPVTFIAAGTGWAPVRALLEELAQHPPDQGVRLFVLARDAAHLYDQAFIDAYAAAFGWLTVTCVTPAPGQHRNGATARLAAALGHCGPWWEQDVYLSGPAQFIQETARLLEGLGAHPMHVFHDTVPVPGAGGGHGPDGRPLGFGEWFLSRPSPHWHNPAARAPRRP